ncbi:MAG: TetR/AcrR family transcriptional regulator [Nitrospirae bacterium]|nr:TetR/AcrR family transcriptional regulator [Nitrospirota bacterium]
MKRRTADQSKRRILDAAGEVFAEKGYAKTTIREVALRSGISIGGIYLYFRNKEELYTGLMREQMDAFCKDTDRVRTREPLDALKSIIDSYMEHALRKTKMLSTNIKEHDLALKKPLKKVFFRFQKQLIRDILQRGMAAGVFKKIDCDETADVVLFCIRGAMLSYLSGEIKALKKHGEGLFQMILHGIRR